MNPDTTKRLRGLSREIDDLSAEVVIIQYREQEYLEALEKASRSLEDSNPTGEFSEDVHIETLEAKEAIEHMENVIKTLSKTDDLIEQITGQRRIDPQDMEGIPDSAKKMLVDLA
jgi:hypothetical protein